MATYNKLANENDFFSLEDTAQRKYEMVRAHEVDGLSITLAAKNYGYSRTTYYTTAERLREEGIEGLIEKKPGPQAASKATEEVVEKIILLRKKNKSIYDIADDLKKEGIKISPRTVERVLKKRTKFKKNDRTLER